MFGKNVYVLELSFSSTLLPRKRVSKYYTSNIASRPYSYVKRPPPPYYVSVSVMIGGNRDISIYYERLQ
jgi:hypothetical protein